MADGRLFIAGGHIADYTGYPQALIYDPGGNSFTAVPDMNAGRWYPTNTLLPNGDVLVVSGDMTSNTSPNPLAQVYQVSTNSWRDLTTAQLQTPLYPAMFVAPNGKVFNAGPSRTTRYLDISGTGAWTVVGSMQFSGTRDYGPGVMYDVGKVLMVGGSDPPTNTAEIINLNSSTPAWTYTGAMNYARRQHSAVALPDGKVFVAGGSSGAGFDNSSTPVYPTEMWDPATGQWTVMASIGAFRGYHSTLLLLPDGRVFSGGGNVAGPTYQIFSPPYLFAGARPTISSAPNTARYGQTVLIGTPNATSISKVTLLALGSTTHTLEQNQRFMRVSFTQTTGGLNVTFPASPNVAPPGYYMLFLLNTAGVPSVAKIIQITASAPTSGTVTGTVTNSSGAALGGATVTAGGASATTFSNGTYNLTNVPSGTVTLSASLAGYQNASRSVTVATGATTSAPTLALAPINPGAVTGTVKNSAAAAISGATVTAAGQSTKTSSLGSYTLANLPAGAITLAASAVGYTASSVQANVTAGATTTAPAITLVANFGAVSGTVRNAAGTAIAGASVSYGGGSTTTNTSGVFSFAKVPVGTIQLVASATGYTTQSQNVTISGGVTSTANFTLSAPTGTVTGRVTNVSTGGAIANATVRWSGGSTLTSSTGTYSLRNVTTGSQSITASATGYLTRTLKANVIGGATTTLNIPLATAGKITVRATFANGTAVSGATVTVKGGVIATTVSGTTNTSGYYYSPWIPIGSYTITVAKSGYVTRSKTATVSTGATTTVTFGF
ncbi:MAG TPA: carboxypeptidase regulatory-like domain-containing protein [Terriglobales bacterium]|nr:carboxypeptidase regulatory-like domain-containing protein [Terriglobales bacterium]